MAALRAIPLGVGDYCSALHYSTSLAVVDEPGDWLLIDCPHPIRKILREASLTSGVLLPLDRLVGVALTHLHADHSSGLEGLGYFSRARDLHPGGVPLFTGPKVADAFRRRSETGLFDVQVVEPGVPRTVGPFRLDARETWHGELDAYAYRVEAAGRMFAHSGDAAFDPELLDWLLAADLVTHELGSGEGSMAIHTGYGQLESWAEGQPPERSGKLRIIHFPDEFLDRPSRIERARQGEVYDV